MSIRIIHADVMDGLAQLPADSVHCVVTSPPYWGLRDYGTGEWEGGDADCDHAPISGLQGNGQRANRTFTGAKPHLEACGRCGARRVDNQLGLEPTLAEHIAKLVEVFEAVRRVLRPDGVLFLNYGDVYAGGGRGNYCAPDSKQATNVGALISGTPLKASGLKAKDNCLIPERLALALQEPKEHVTIKKIEDRAWLAAVLDTDGCMGIRKQKNSGNGGADWNHTYIPYISVSVTDVNLLEHCVKLTGFGSVRLKATAEHMRKSGMKARRDIYTWRLDGNKAIMVLRDVWRWLIVKQKQAACICALDDSNKFSDRGRAEAVNMATMEQRQRLFELTKSLNQREQVDVPSWVKEPHPWIEPGWYVRDRIIWRKPNPMPSSVTDRCTPSYEIVYMLTKKAKYWWDAEAIKEPVTGNAHARRKDGERLPAKGTEQNDKRTGTWKETYVPEMRNCRNVWEIGTFPMPEAHFATFPPKLVERALLAACPEKVCAECGAGWVREVERVPTGEKTKMADGWNTGPGAHGTIHPNGREAGQQTEAYRVETLGWSPSCTCQAETTAGTCLDPFGGSGTVGLVADRMNRNAILIELSRKYVDMARRRLEADAGLFANVELTA